MTKSYTLALKSSICVAAMALSAPALYAEEIDSVKYQGDLDELLVTATKRNTLKKELSSSVSILGRQILEQTQFRGIKDINAYVPNVYIPDFGSSYSTPIYIRGIGSRRINMIGLYSDGVPLLEGGAIDTDYSDVRSIEVLRGPQGTLFGRGALGGIINLRSYRPLTDQGTHLQLTAGQYGVFGLNAQSYQALNDHWGLGANINYQHRDGYYTNTFNNKPVDQSNNYSTKFAVQYRKRGWDIYGFLQYQQREQGGYPYAMVKKDGILSDVNYNQPSHYKRHLLTTGISLEKFWNNDLNIKSATSYQRLKDEFLMDQDFSPAPMIVATQNTSKHVFTHETSLSRKRGRYTWITGVYGFGILSDKSVENNLNMPPRNVSEMYITYEEPSHGFALFHQSNYKITDRLTAELGLRYDWEWSKQNYGKITVNKLQGNATTKEELPASAIDRQFTPKFSLNYRLGKGQHIYASVLRGYQASGFNVQFDRPEEQIYKPEYSWNYELGTHLDLLGGALQFDASAFYIDWEQQQVQLPITSGLGSKIVNAGRSRSVGAELSLRYRPMDNLNLSAAYGYTHATFQEYEEVRIDRRTRERTIVSHKDKYIPQVPQQTISATADYTYHTRLSYLDRVKFAVQYRGLGDIYWDNANTQRQAFYHLVDAQISFARKGLSLELWCRNLGDTTYRTFQFNSMGNEIAQRGLQRHCGATLRLKF